MILSHKHKLVLFKPIKVGGSSVELAFSNHCGPNDVLTGTDLVEEKEIGYRTQNNQNPRYHTHTSPTAFFQMTGEKFKDYHKVSIVRNPWDLAVSYFWWSYYGPENSFYPDLRPYESDDPDDLKKKFSEFVNCRASFANTAASPGKNVTMPIVSWLASRTLEYYPQEIDRILKFETLQEDYNCLCEDLGTPLHELPRLKTSQRKSSIHYSEYYDAWSRSAVRRTFFSLIERFQYKFDDI